MARLVTHLVIDRADVAAYGKHLEWIMREFGAATMEDIDQVQPHKRRAFMRELKAASLSLLTCVGSK